MPVEADEVDWGEVVGAEFALVGADETPGDEGHAGEDVDAVEAGHEEVDAEEDVDVVGFGSDFVDRFLVEDPGGVESLEAGIGAEDFGLLDGVTGGRGGDGGGFGGGS